METNNTITMFPGNWHGSRINKHCGRQRAWNWLEIEIAMEFRAALFRFEFFGVGATRVCRTSALWISKVDAVGKMQPYFEMRNILSLTRLLLSIPSPKCWNLMIRPSTVWNSFEVFYKPIKTPIWHNFFIFRRNWSFEKAWAMTPRRWRRWGFWWRDASFLVWCVVQPCFIKKNEGWH